MAPALLFLCVVMRRSVHKSFVESNPGGATCTFLRVKVRSATSSKTAERGGPPPPAAQNLPDSSSCGFTPGVRRAGSRTRNPSTHLYANIARRRASGRALDRAGAGSAERRASPTVPARLARDVHEPIRCPFAPGAAPSAAAPFRPRIFPQLSSQLCYKTYRRRRLVSNKLSHSP